MKTKKLTPRNAAPVQRENTATVFRDRNAITTSSLSKFSHLFGFAGFDPFAGDDAE